MAKPSAPVTWSTDANFATGPDVGLSTRLEPASGVKAQGFIPEEEVPARWMNWALGLLGDWTGYLDALPTDADFVDEDFVWGGEHTFNGDVTFNGFTTIDGTLNISSSNVAVDGLRVTNTIGIAGTTNEAIYTDLAGAADPRPRTVNVSLSNPGFASGTTGEMSGLGFFTVLNPGSIYYPIILPRGSVLTGLDVHVRNITGGTVNVTIALEHVQPNFSVPAGLTSLATSYTATQAVASLGGHIFSTTGLAMTVDNSVEFFQLRITNDTSIQVLGARYTFDDPGPRNG